MHIGIYILYNLGTCTWSLCCIFTGDFEGWFGHVTMGCNISMVIRFYLFGVCKPKSCNILNLLLLYECLCEAWAGWFRYSEACNILVISSLSVRIIYIHEKLVGYLLKLLFGECISVFNWWFMIKILYESMNSLNS